MFKLRALEKNIQLTFNLPQYIETDPVKLNQILINLIENAIKFTDKGRVTLNLKFTDRSEAISLAFAVIDTGHGILPSQLESIFIPFTQTKQCDRQGTGLGLSICQQFVRLLGGEITVSSKLGQGSLFKFQIPITVVEHQDNLTVEPVIRNYSFSPAKHQKLSRLNLANMPTAWLEELYQAAITVDSDLILQLISQIPTESSILAQRLTRMLKNFEYNEIVELVETSCKGDRSY